MYKAIAKKAAEDKVQELKSTKLQTYFQERFAMLCRTAAHKSGEEVHNLHQELSARDKEGLALTLTLALTTTITVTGTVVVTATITLQP